MMQAVPSVQAVVHDAVSEHRDKIGALMPVLHSVQERLGFIPPEAVPLIAAALNRSRAEVQGVIGFYHDFRTSPAGRHIVQICRAEACQAMGSAELEAHVKQRLGIDFGATSADGAVTLEAVYCLGNCACSPSVRVGDRIHARVNGERFDQILSDLENGR